VGAVPSSPWVLTRLLDVGTSSEIPTRARVKPPRAGARPWPTGARLFDELKAGPFHVSLRRSVHEPAHSCGILSKNSPLELSSHTMGFVPEITK
jgi:hypothetical protein